MSSGWIASAKFVKQGLGVLQIRRVKPFGELPIHRRQQFVRLLALALALP